MEKGIRPSQSPGFGTVKEIAIRLIALTKFVWNDKYMRAHAIICMGIDDV